MTDQTRCSFDNHGHPLYLMGSSPLPTHLIRITCPDCDHFRIQAWCDCCWQGVNASGLDWRCSTCHRRYDEAVKLTEILTRIGDA